jgi:methionyl-tRNA formyltransferase
MRVTLLLNRDLHANVALNLLMPSLGAYDLSIFLSDGPARPTSIPMAFGPLVAAERTLPNSVLWPLADALPDDGTTYGSFARCAARLGATCATLNDPNGADGLRLLREARPDVVVSIRYGRILREKVIAIPRFGVLNLHSGQLPEYRGVVATFRALLQEDTAVGCTLHRIVDAGIDTGPIIGVATRPAARSAVLFDAIQSVYPEGCAMISDALASLARGEPLRATAPASQGSYYTWPTEGEVASFLALGHQLVDLSSYTRLIARYVPGDADPHPT